MDHQNYLVVSDELGVDEMEVQADSFEDAAVEAMEQWESGGSFAGEYIHGEYLLLVVNRDTRKSASVKVTVEYEPTYTAETVEEHE